MDRWQAVKCSRAELNLAMVLKNGQSFRWAEIETEFGWKEWTGVMKNRVWRFRQNSDSEFEFSVIGRFSRNLGTTKNDKDVETVRDYFQLDKVNLQKLYAEWAAKDEFFRNMVFGDENSKRKYQGIRILRQDPVECLFSFICSQNNNIQRISGMIEKLCTAFGEPLILADGRKFYDFPRLDSLAEIGVAETLKNLRFGYRSSYVYESARKIRGELGGETWLWDLRNKSYEEAKASLLTLPGVGAKVADCVCLMSLDKNDTVPVDTHVFQVTTRNYLPHLRKINFTEKTRREIEDWFKEKYGGYAGWIQSVLFSSDLRQFSENKSTKTKDGEKRRKMSETPSPAKTPKQQKNCS